MDTKVTKIPRILIIGGGAGGLELATRLGNHLGKKKLAEIVLVDRQLTHIWKPLLHEVAAGTFDSHENELDYMAQAAHNHFVFRLGSVSGIDRENRQVIVAPTHNNEGEEIIPERVFQYDILVMAVGSISNYFDLPGVKQHCLFLDTTEQAERFQNKLLQVYIKANTHKSESTPCQLDVAIIGAGATGIELAAQLHEVSRLLNTFGLEQVTPADIKITVIEAAPRILPGVDEHIAEATLKQLDKLGIHVLTNERVVEVDEKAVHTANGRHICAGIPVWAAGIKAPDFLQNIEGLETNKIGQLAVKQTLQVTHDEDIYAIGDCAACDWTGHQSTVPPRAQAAHQMASLAARSIEHRIKGKQGALPEFTYRDYGSLVSLGKYSTVGSLMGNLLGTVNLEGFVARLVYLSLYKMHQYALFGFSKTLLLSLSHLFRRSVYPKIKLH